MRRCVSYRSQIIKDEYIKLGDFIEINKKILKVFAVFLKSADYCYLAKLYENSNHYFFVSEVKKSNCRKYEVLTSFTGDDGGLEKSIDVLYKILGENENYQKLQRIR